MDQNLKQTAEYEQRDKLRRLLDDVKARHVQPEDRYEIAALLESMGWNDERAARTFGVENVFELAALLWDMSKSNVIFTPFAKVEKMGLRKTLITMVEHFLRGVIFALPMAVSVFAMITLRFSLWSYEDLAVDVATGIAIGTILSFVTMGGFAQAIARRGFFYMIQGYYKMARKVTFHFIMLGTLACLALSGLLLVTNVLIKLFPFDMIMIIILYYFFLNTIWLSVTVMYILRKEIVFTGLIIVGIFIVYLLFSRLHIPILLSQLSALLLVSLMAIGAALYFFKREEKKAERGMEPRLPKMSVTLYNVMPYFLYGLTYFAFLFVDRIIAWSVDTAFLPYFIWFRGDYELGLDFSLLVLIIPMGINEVVLSKLMLDIQASQKGYRGHEIKRMNRKYMTEYFIRAFLIFIIALASAFFVYHFVAWVMDDFNPEMGAVIYKNPVTHFVFVCSLLAYVLLSVALMNAVTLFSLSQPGKVVQAIWPAFVVNITVGFVLSRWFEFHFAVIGLIAGSLVFLIASTYQVTGVLKKLDYYMYAAA